MTAVAFHSDDIKKSWTYAEKFAGEGGRVATLPDIIAARLSKLPDEEFAWPVPWDSFLTSSSAEYAGLSKGGTPIFIVAHGRGPLSTLKGVLKAYSKDSGVGEEHCRPSCISRKEFLQLESGHYGDVSIVPFEETVNRRPDHFFSPFEMWDVMGEPLLQARLGDQWEVYADAHQAYAHKWQKENNQKGACMILSMDQPNPGGYSVPGGLGFRPEIGGTDATHAMAHLLVLDQLVRINFFEYRNTQLVSSVGLHNASSSTRCLGIRKDSDLSKVVNAPALYELIPTHWRDLLVPCKRSVKSKMLHIKKRGDTWFTCKAKGDYHEMDTGILEHVAKDPIMLGGGPKTFTTKIEGYHGFLRYSLKEVVAIAPEGANAYMLGETGFAGEEYHKVEVFFFKADIDTSHRLITDEELSGNFDLLLNWALTR